MSLLIFAIVILIVVSIISAVVYYLPLPPPVAWIRWVIPLIALLIGAVVILQRMGVA